MTTTDLVPVKELSLDVPRLISEIDKTLEKAMAAVSAKLPAEIKDQAAQAAAFELRDNLKFAHDSIKEQRLPLTRRLDEIKGMFTAKEKAFLDLIAKVEEKTSAFAQMKLAEQRRAEAEAEAKVEAERKRIEAESKARILLQSRVDAYLDKIREHAGSMVRSVTSENIGEYERRLQVDVSWEDTYLEHYQSIPEGIAVGEDKFKEIVLEVHDDHMAYFLKEARAIMDETKNMLPMALKNKGDAEKLMEADQARVAREREEKNQSENARVEAEAALASLDNAPPVEDIKAKIDYEIEVSQPEAWLKIVAFWWEHEDASKKTLDKVQRMTFDRAKKFAERYAKKHGKVVNHPGLEYVEQVKGKK